MSLRSSHPEVFLGKDALKICSKFTEEHPCRSVISIKLYSKNILLFVSSFSCTFWHVLFYKQKQSSRGVLIKEVFLEISQNLPESPCARPQDCNFIKKETLAQVFSYKFCEICKNTFFHRAPQVATSVVIKSLHFEIAITFCN